MGTQYMWGRDLLVAPVFEKGASSRSVYLPQGDWYDWWTNKKETGGQTITKAVDLATMPIYVRAGAIVPFDPVRQYVAEVINEPTTIKVFQGANGQYTLYEDDGISLDYLKGGGTTTNFSWNDASKKLTIQPGSLKGKAAERKYKVQLLPAGTMKEINYNGRAVNVSF